MELFLVNFRYNVSAINSWRTIPCSYHMTPVHSGCAVRVRSDRVTCGAGYYHVTAPAAGHTHTHTHSLTHTHTYAETHSLTHTHTHSLTRTKKRTYTPIHTHTHTHTHGLFQGNSEGYSQAHTLPHVWAHTHTHTHTLTHQHTRTHTHEWPGVGCTQNCQGNLISGDATVTHGANLTQMLTPDACSVNHVKPAD